MQIAKRSCRRLYKIKQALIIFALLFSNYFKIVHLLTLKYCLHPLNAFVCLMQTPKHPCYCFSAHHGLNQAFFTNFYRLSKSPLPCQLLAHLHSINQNCSSKNPVPHLLLAYTLSKKEEDVSLSPFSYQLLAHLHSKIKNRPSKSSFTCQLLAHPLSKKKRTPFQKHLHAAKTTKATV